MTTVAGSYAYAKRQTAVGGHQFVIIVTGDTEFYWHKARKRVVPRYGVLPTIFRCLDCYEVRSEVEIKERRYTPQCSGRLRAITAGESRTS